MIDDKLKRSLSKEQETKVLEWLNKKRPEKNLTCEICSSTQWMILGDVITTSIYHPGGSGSRGNTYPQFMIMCTSCGLIKYFNAVISGVIKVAKKEKNVESSKQTINRWYTSFWLRFKDCIRLCGLQD